MAECVGLPPISRRYQHSAQFDTTNFAFGDDARSCMSTYDKDYTENVAQRGQLSGAPACLLQRRRVTRMQKLQDISNFSPVLPGRENLEKDKIACDRTKSNRYESVVRCESQRRSNVTFGHDALSRSTAYGEQSAGRKHGERRRSFPTPETAEIVPPAHGKVQRNSTLRTDYMNFSRFSKAMRSNDPYPEVKDIHMIDSVSKTLFGKHYRMLTRSHVDYRPPINNVPFDNLTAWMAKSITPTVRTHPIWKSENGGGIAGGSEHDNQYVWHCKKQPGEQ